MPLDHMTIANLAEALRGIPRDAVIMLETPDGLKPLRMVSGAHGSRSGDGALTPLAAGASVPTGSGYIVILQTHR